MYEFLNDKKNRNNILVLVSNVFISILLLKADPPLWIIILMTFSIMTGVFILVVSIINAKEERENEFSKMIESLSVMSGELDKFKNILEREQQKVEKAELAINKLKDEKNSLQPIVESDRDKVDAILAAYKSRNRRDIWKDRFIGFTFTAILAIFIEYAVPHLLGLFQ